MSDLDLERIFKEGRSQARFLDQAVPDALLEEIWELAALGPTSANSQPLRVVFVRSAEAKERLKPCLSKGNTQKTMDAPLTAIFAYDHQFYDLLPKLNPISPEARSWFAGDQAKADQSALLSAALQAAYVMVIARGKGLTCGPMTGFDSQKCDAAFFADGRHASFMLCNLGYGDPAEERSRQPRLDFDEIARIL